MDNILYIILALIMFATGNSVEFSKFGEAFKKPKNIFVGLFLQMILLPLLTFLMVIYIDIPVEFKIGFCILSVCPGGTTSNFISYLINANIALSVALTSINSLLILFTIPVFTDFILNYFNGVDSTQMISIFDTFYQVLFIIIIPASLGAYLRYKNEQFSNTIKKPFKIINIILLGSFYTYKFLAAKKSGGITTEEIITIAPYAFILHIISILSSYFISKKMKLNKMDCITIGIEVGLQNSGLAILIGSTMLRNYDIAKPALVFAMFTFFTTLSFGLIGNKFFK